MQGEIDALEISHFKKDEKAVLLEEAMKLLSDTHKKCENEKEKQLLETD